MADSKPADTNHNNPVSEHPLAQFNGSVNIGNPSIMQASSPIKHTLQLPVPDSRASTPGLPAWNACSRQMSPEPWELIQPLPSALPLPVPGSRTATPGPQVGHTYNAPIAENEAFQLNGDTRIGSPTIQQHIVVMAPNDHQRKLLPYLHPVQWVP